MHILSHQPNREVVEFSSMQIRKYFQIQSHKITTLYKKLVNRQHTIALICTLICRRGSNGSTPPERSSSGREVAQVLSSVRRLAHFGSETVPWQIGHRLSGLRVLPHQGNVVLNNFLMCYWTTILTKFKRVSNLIKKSGANWIVWIFFSDSPFTHAILLLSYSTVPLSTHLRPPTRRCMDWTTPKPGHWLDKWRSTSSSCKGQADFRYISSRRTTEESTPLGRE